MAKRLVSWDEYEELIPSSNFMQGSCVTQCHFCSKDNKTGIVKCLDPDKQSNYNGLCYAYPKCQHKRNLKELSGEYIKNEAKLRNIEMFFGKYAYKPIHKIISKDPRWLLWLAKQGQTFGIIADSLQWFLLDIINATELQSYKLAKHVLAEVKTSQKLSISNQEIEDDITKSLGI